MPKLAFAAVRVGTAVHLKSIMITCLVFKISMKSDRKTVFKYTPPYSEALKFKLMTCEL